ncbi:ATP-binding cassette domain-containing protein [Alteromonas genovensis]|uniref:ATP-binding cassette domain-containing protein n=1 Tax=Alteromonas genovensis TaxID=471225 RepID=A0A6N9TJ58_9ALTE|nr:ATP-binding cassette domain-containing protein [Alteromonas genovensis]NDW16532.1 ATP-binding cassette domain-containing protein [Alteromonas genovensis]
MSVAFEVLLPSRIEGRVELRASSSFIGITGPSGAGKSSLLRCIAGFEKGALTQANWGNMSTKIGIVFQQPLLFPHVNVEGNLQLATRHASEHAISINEAVKGCHCEHLLSKQIATLSGGEAQRVAIARALVNGPHILLLDESLSAIDAVTRRHIYAFLRHLCAVSQLTCFVVSHDIDELLLLSDEMIYVCAGKIKAVGNVDSVVPNMYQGGAIHTPSAILNGVVECIAEATLSSHAEESTHTNAEKTTHPEQEMLIEHATDFGEPDQNTVYQVIVSGQRLYVSQKSLIAARSSIVRSKVASFSECEPNQADKNEIDNSLSAGGQVRLAVKASEVSIDTNTAAMTENSTSSILNSLNCVIEDITHFDNHKSGRVLLNLRIINQNDMSEDEQPALHAVISTLSVSRLQLAKNMLVIARFKLL